MHEVAEYGVAAHWIYKQDSPQVEGRQYRWMRELLDILEHADNPAEFLEHTKLEMFQDQVFCFTPQGAVIALPSGATPEIGRGSCRERVCQYVSISVVAVSLQTQDHNTHRVYYRDEPQLDTKNK